MRIRRGSDLLDTPESSRHIAGNLVAADHDPYPRRSEGHGTDAITGGIDINEDAVQSHCVAAGEEEAGVRPDGLGAGVGGGPLARGRCGVRGDRLARAGRGL